MQGSKLRILGVERDNKACGYYRILNPLNHVLEQGLADCNLIEYGTEFDTDENMRRVFESDIILLPRPSSEEWFGFVKACRKAGKIIVSDYDDDPFTCDPMNPYYRWIGVEEWSHPEFGDVWKDGMIGADGSEWFNLEKNVNRRDMLRAAFKNSDLVTCTTPELQEVFKKINPNTVVLPNYIDMDAYVRPEFVKRKIRIGWQGGVSHYRDLHFILPVLERVAKNPDVELVYFGDTIRFEKLLGKHPWLQMHGFVNHETYPYKMSLMNLDIGICPLVDNEFNRRKSAIKYFEYTAIGAATVASNIPPYSPVIEHGKNGILVEEDPKAWEDALLSLVTNRKKILELFHAADENVKKNHTIQANAHKWVDAYKNIIQKEMVKV